MTVEMAQKKVSAFLGEAVSSLGSAGTFVRGQKTFLLYAIATVAQNAAAVVVTFAAFRSVDPVAMGIWQTLIVAQNWVGIVRAGILNGLNRELPFSLGQGNRQKAEGLAASALFATVWSVLIGTAIFLAAIPILMKQGEDWVPALLAVAILTGVGLYTGYLHATFRSSRDFQKLSHVLLAQAAAGIVLLPLILVWGFRGFCVHAVIQVAVTVWLSHFWRPIKVRPAWDRAHMWVLLATGIPMFFNNYLGTLAQGMDKVVLLMRGGVESVGLYAPALAVQAAFTMVPGTINSYLYPRLSFRHGEGHNPRHMWRSVFRGGLAAFACGLPMFIAGWILLPDLVSQYFPKYAASIPVLRVSLLTGLILAPTTALTALPVLKRWRLLYSYSIVMLAARFLFPWFLSSGRDPLVGTAWGTFAATLLGGTLAMTMAHFATSTQPAPKLEANDA